MGQQAKSLRLLPQSFLDDATTAAVRYAAFFCSKRPWLDYEDVEEAARIGAFYAWDRYDPLALPRRTWKSWRDKQIGWEVSHSLRPTYRRYSHFPWMVSLNELLPGYADQGGQDTGLGEMEEDPESRRRMEASELGMLADQLPEHERWVIGQLYFGNMSHSDVARQLQVDPPYVEALEQSALTQLRALWNAAVPA